MDQQTIIADIEARARAVGLTIGEACQRAKLHPTTFSRWKLSNRNPRPVGANLASLSRLQAVVADAASAMLVSGEGGVADHEVSASNEEVTA